MSAVLTFTDRGIYCPAADVYIDPWKPVDRALITHGHADHARPGSKSYLATHAALPVIRHRLGSINDAGLSYGEERRIGDAKVTFHPAGHIPGSAQIRVDVKGEVWVVSGDYKTVADNVSQPFEPVPCHTFISECTFGLPVFSWDDPPQVAKEINQWWANNAANSVTSICGAYSLGKAQRILADLDFSIGPVLTHGAVEAVNEVLRAQGVALPQTIRVTPDLDIKQFKGAFVIAPPASLDSAWSRRFRPSSTAFASGWMALRGVRRRRSADRGFVMSDHADWSGLNEAIKATGCERVFVTHGYTYAFRNWLEQQGYDAGIVTTEFGDSDDQED